ncbi:protoporphyrinogen oxidase-like [Lineus longissimus]|uniref:protoporphyrinogen oxidase-like n=1 Tax=Lineus longissimus TaxID=88925 RepID=UPI002B4E9A66
MAQVAIVGGGATGLATAFYLSRYAHYGRHIVKKIILLEGAEDVGGWIQTTRMPDGAVFEHGPRSLRSVGKSGINTLELAEALGLEDEILAVRRGHPVMKYRFIYMNGKRHAVPSNLMSAILPGPPFNQSLVWTLIKEVLKAGEKGLKDDTIHNFVSRRLGTNLADYAADPVVRGIFAGDIRELSIKAVAPELFEFEQKHGSIIVGGLRRKKEKLELSSDLVKKAMGEKWGIWSLKKGLKQLAEAMEKDLRKRNDVEIVTGTKCQGLTFSEGKVKVKTEKKEYTVDHVFSTIFAPNTAQLLPIEHVDLKKKLSKIQAGTVAVVNVEYNGVPMPDPGFGHLIPSKEPEKNLGVVYDSMGFPGHDRKDKKSQRFTVMLGGAWFNKLFGPPEYAKNAEIEDAALTSLRNQLGIMEDPERTILNVQKNCIPQYKLGHTKLCDDIWSYTKENKLPLSLLGCSYKGVSVNDCIYNARLEVARVFPDLFRPT